MVYFQTKTRNLGTFWRVLQWKRLVYFMDIWSILRPFDIFCDHLVYFVVIRNIFPRFGICTYQERSGNPVLKHNDKGSYKRARKFLKFVLGGIRLQRITEIRYRIKILQRCWVDSGIEKRRKNIQNSSARISLESFRVKRISFGVARWYIYKPKIAIWVKFGVSCKLRSWYISWPFNLLWTFDLFWLFGIFFTFWYVVRRKIWQPWSAFDLLDENGCAKDWYHFLTAPLGRNLTPRGEVSTQG
jgi:hypothetical protein